MAHEESESPFDAVDDVVELLGTSPEAADVQSGTWLEIAVRRFDLGDHGWELVPTLEEIKRPEALARCLYEFERRDPKRGIEITQLVRDEFWKDDGLRDRYNRAFPFLEKLRKHGEDEGDENGFDGGAGDREPQPPLGPRDTDAAALEVPRAETQTESADRGGDVALLEHPDELDPDKE